MREPGRPRRRDVLRLLGVGAGLGLASPLRGLDLLAWQAAAGKGTVTFPKGAIIRTILKDFRPEDVTSGSILFHEHVSLSTPWMQKLRGGRGEPQSWFMEDFDLMTAEMQAAKKDGLSIIVDGGHLDQGRSVDFLKRLSERSGLPIVVSGGYYLPISYPPEVSTLTEDQLADILVRDAKAQRWGALGEIGSGETISANERKVFRAIGKTQARTSLAIFTHTANGAAAIEQLDILESAGATPQRVVIGHLGGLVMPEIAVHKAICKRGAFVGFDRVARTPESDTKQIGAIRELIDAGYLDHILLSSDFANEADIKSKGGPGYAKTVTVFLPKLRQSGVSDEMIRRIVLDNQRRFLAFVPKA